METSNFLTPFEIEFEFRANYLQPDVIRNRISGQCIQDFEFINNFWSWQPGSRDSKSKSKYLLNSERHSKSSFEFSCCQESTFCSKRCHGVYHDEAFTKRSCALTRTLLWILSAQAVYAALTLAAYLGGLGLSEDAAHYSSYVPQGLFRTADGQFFVK